VGMDIIGLYKTEVKIEKFTPVIYLFSRGQDRKKNVQTVPFSPYLYIDKKLKTILLQNPLVYKIEDIDRKAVDGTELIKVYIPHSIYDETTRRYKCYEADVPYSTRYLLDNKIKIIHSDYKKLYIDIETDDEHGFADYKKPIEKITAISMMTNYNDSMITFLLNPENGQNYDLNTPEWQIMQFNDEKEMLESFLRIFSMMDVDIITGWNVIDFDMFYIVNRMKALHIDYKLLSPYHEVELVDQDLFGKFKKEINISGIVVYDMLFGYKKLTLKEIPSYSLEYVSRQELKQPKKRLLNISDTWRKDTKKFLEYNRKDVDVIKELDAKIKIVDYADEIKNLGVLNSVNSSFFFSNSIDNLMIQKYQDKVVFINKSKFNVDIKIKGGYVKEPNPDLYEWVFVWDFSALYPSIIKTFKISYETVNSSTYNILFNTDEDDTRLETIKLNYIKTAMLPGLVDDLMDWRNSYKAIMKRYPENTPEHQEALRKNKAGKALINSLFGVLVNKFYRLYNPAAGALITFLGRTMIQEVIKNIEEHDKLNVIGSDSTDENTTLLLKYKNKLVTKAIYDIPNFIKCQIIFEKGKTYYRLLEQIEVLSFDFKSNQPVFKQIKSIISHKTNKKVQYIRKKNMIISVTDDHSVFLENGKTISGKEIRPDTILKQFEYKIDFSNKIFKIDLYEYLKDYQAQGKINKNKYIIKTDNKIILNRKALTKNYKGHFKQISINRNIVLNKEFGELLGFYIAEGSVTQKNQNIQGFRLANLNQQYLQHYLTLGNKIFGNNTFWKNAASYYITANTLIAKIFAKMGGITSEYKHLPSFILDTNMEFFEGILLGFVKGDGEQKFISQYMNINRIGNKSKQLISELYFILKNIYKYNYNELTLETRPDKTNYGLRWKRDFINSNGSTFFKSKQQQINNFLRLDTSYRKIIRIPKNNIVWDLSVQDTENFVDICGNVVLHNTDSIFVHIPEYNGRKLNDIPKEELADVLKEISNKYTIIFNTYVKTIVKLLLKEYFDEDDYHLYLSPEKVFNKLLETGKKHYCGNIIYAEGRFYDKPNLKLVGVAMKKITMPKIVNDGLLEFVNNLFNGEDYIANIKAKVKMIRKCKDPEQFQTPIKCNKKYKGNLPQKRALDFANNRFGLNLRIGARFFMIWSLKGKINSDIMAYDSPERLTENLINGIDHDKYVDIFLENINLLYEVKGLENISTNQQVLNKFFGGD
jgi:hypothetical protein